MTDDLKHRFEQLVADPPPASEAPSEAVFARVRSVRRRRTAGVVTLATAAVVAVTVAVGNLSDIKGQPPVTHTTNTPTTVVTASPTTTPTTIPTKTTTSTQTTGAVDTPKNNTPPPSTPNTAAAPQLGVHVALKPVVQGRTVTMKVTVSGTELVPTDMLSRRPMSTSGTDFINLMGGTRYFWGDGHDSGSDPGTMGCVSGTRRITRQQTYTLPNESGQPNVPGSHTYAQAGTYTVSYTIKYCGNNGWVPVTKTVQVTVK